MRPNMPEDAPVSPAALAGLWASSREAEADVVVEVEAPRPASCFKRSA